jgi:thiol-disulfide isomerase/thioredoxin
MKNMKAFLKAIVICLLFSQSILLQAQTGTLAFVPKIQYDKATLSGKIEGVRLGDKGFKPISMRFSNVVTGEVKDYQIPVKDDGSFSFNLMVQCLSICTITSDYFEGLICLVPGEETKLEISFDGDQKRTVKLLNSINLTVDDAANLMGVIMEAITHAFKLGNEILAPEIFSQRAINRLQEAEKKIDASDKLSLVAKQIAKSELKLWCIAAILFSYEDYMSVSYSALHKSDTLQKVFNAQIPSKSYYSFLKYFDLNDPVYLTSSSYTKVIESLLSNKTLAIPSIGEMTISKWLSKVKEILKGDIGSDKGIFYDLLVSHVFTRQLNDMNPLNTIQKADIKSNFANKSFVNILMDENEKVIQLTANRKKARIHDISKASDRVMDSIISKYKGKVVFVDFWATWCVPCLKAMRESESVRKEFENKKVVFVYITNPSSPRKVWETKLSEIGGEHYYVSDIEWDYLNKSFGFTGIPHYLIYDKNGTLKYNYHTFMGNEKMSKWISESL